jgi:hypothetical protein
MVSRMIGGRALSLGHSGKVMDIWTIYDHPTDYPDSFVARRSVISKHETITTTDMFVADTLEELEALLPRGMAWIPRMKMDDPKIVGVWI